MAKASSGVRNSTSHSVAAQFNMKLPQYVCDGCLWRPVPKMGEASYSCVTCLHCYCVHCLTDLAEQSKVDRRGGGKVSWFRCPVPPCAIMIQANHQLKELSNKILPTPIQYLVKSVQKVKQVVAAQKVASFHLETSSGHIKTLQRELSRQMKVIAKKEAKLTEVIKRYGEVKEAYDKLKQKLIKRTERRSAAGSDYETGHQSEGGATGLTFLDQGHSTPKKDNTLLF